MLDMEIKCYERDTSKTLTKVQQRNKQKQCIINFSVSIRFSQHVWFPGQSKHLINGFLNDLNDHVSSSPKQSASGPVGNLFTLNLHY